jgi:SAM-dependent methyltransferase
LSAKESETRSLVEDLWWWHTIELPGGVRTPGHDRIDRQDFVARNIPQDLSGKAVLDIGAADGFFSFLAEKRRAAKVVAIDAHVWSKPEERAVGIGPDGKRFLKTFVLAKDALHSSVSYENLDLFELDALPQKFDVVFLFGVYYHLEDPAKGFQIIAKRMNPGGLLFFEGSVRSGNRKSVLHRFRKSEMGPTTFCSANVAWLTEAFRDSGLERVGGVSLLRHKNTLLNLTVELGWALGLNFGPYKRAYRAFMTFKKPA